MGVCASTRSSKGMMSLWFRLLRSKATVLSLASSGGKVCWSPQQALPGPAPRASSGGDHSQGFAHTQLWESTVGTYVVIGVICRHSDGDQGR